MVPNIQLGNAGVITATSFDGSFAGGIDGTATNADGITTARNFSITGDGSAPAVSFNGRDNVELDFTLDNLKLLLLVHMVHLLR